MLGGELRGEGLYPEAETRGAAIRRENKIKHTEHARVAKMQCAAAAGWTGGGGGRHRGCQGND